MKLTKDNYFSPEANREYFSVSQFKSFMQCEARAMAELTGAYKRPMTDSLLVGSYVDAWFEGTLGAFKEAHPEVFKKDGSIKAQFVRAEELIERATQDTLFMEYMNGESQVIKTGKLFGYDWKIKIDSDHPDKIVDLKTVKDFEDIYQKGDGYVGWVEYWGYDLQGAVYQAIDGNNKPFILAAITKEKTPDIDLISIPQPMLNTALKIIEHNIDHVAEVKAGFTLPKRCGKCDYCKATKKLTTLTEYKGEE